MNAERVMAAIGQISDKHIEEWAVVRPVKHDKINCMIIRRKWFCRVCACLAVIAIAMGIAIPVLNNKNMQPSLVLTAYALDNNGAVTAQTLTDSIQLPVSLLEMSDGSKGFLFSVDCPSREEPPSLAIVTAGDSEYSVDELNEIVGFDLDSGKQYFFFVEQDIDDFESTTFFYSDEETGSTFEICIKIARSEDGYSASLQELKSFPSKTAPTD